MYRQGVYGPRHQWIFWENSGHFDVVDDKYIGTGCNKQEVLHACNYLIVLNAAKPSPEDDESVVGDSGYVSPQV